MNPIENLTIPSHAFGSQSDVTVTQAGPGTIVTVPVTVLTETSHGTAPCARGFAEPGSRARSGSSDRDGRGAYFKLNTTRRPGGGAGSDSRGLPASTRGLPDSAARQCHGAACLGGPGCPPGRTSGLS